jgi:hypothetical protein
MGRFLVRSIAAAGALAFAGLSTQGCADNESMLFVRAVLKLEAPDCVGEPDPNSVFLPYGVIDTTFGTSYYSILLIGNQLVQRGSKNQVRTETARITLKGAEVTVLDDQDNALAEFTVPGTGFVDPGEGEEAGYGAMGAELLPPNLGVAAGDRLVVEVRVFGDTLGGDEIESSVLRYPIYVCNRCLIAYPADADDPVQPGYQCSTAKEPTEAVPCFFGQDNLIDCRHCLAYPECQAP